MTTEQLSSPTFEDRTYEVLKPYKIVQPCSFVCLRSDIALLLSFFHAQENRTPLHCPADRFTSLSFLREALYLFVSAKQRITQRPPRNPECSQPCRSGRCLFLMFLSLLFASTGITLCLIYKSVWFLVAQGFGLAGLLMVSMSTVNPDYAARVPGVALSFSNNAVYLSPRYEEPFPQLSVSTIRYFAVAPVNQREHNIGQGLTGSEQASDQSCYCLEAVTLGEVLLIGSCTNKQSIMTMADEANVHLQQMRERDAALLPPLSLFPESQDDYQQASVQLTSSWVHSDALPRTHGLTVEHRGDQTVAIRLHNPQRCSSSVKALLLLILISNLIFIILDCEKCHEWRKVYWIVPSILYSMGVLLVMNFMSCEWTTIIFSQERTPFLLLSPLTWMMARLRYFSVKNFDRVHLRRTAASRMEIKQPGAGLFSRKWHIFARGGRRYEVELKSAFFCRKDVRFSQLCEGQARTIARLLLLKFPLLSDVPHGDGPQASFRTRVKYRQ